MAMSIHLERPSPVDANGSRLHYIQALVVPLDRKPEVQRLEPCEMSYHLLIGGFVDVVYETKTWKAISSEGCQLAGAAANPFANSLVRLMVPAFNDVLCGNVLFVGRYADGGDADAPADLLHEAKALLDS
jgi:hypothetical protein